MIDEIDPNTPDNVDKVPDAPNPPSNEQPTSPVTPEVIPAVEQTASAMPEGGISPNAVTSTEQAPAPTDGATSDDGIKPLPKRKTLSIIIHDAGVLRAAYMQFVKGGGLFIPTKKPFIMGEDTNLVIRLLDDDEPYRVSGKVVWITPFGSPNNKAGGIGVEFIEDKNGEKLRNRIELLLGPHLKSTESTHTM